MRRWLSVVLTAVALATVTPAVAPTADCAGQTGHNFGPCPGFVSPAPTGQIQAP